MDPSASNLPAGVYVIWAVTLGLVVLVVVPLAVVLLHRTARAAWSIRRYLREMLEAGTGIAGHTAAIAALDDTSASAATLVDVAGRIRGHSEAAATVLAARAAQGARP
jgi:hypothetical protein